MNNNQILMIGVAIPPLSTGYGRLYNWYCASDPNFAPDGWRVPTVADYGILIAGNNLKEIGLTYWITPNTGGTNDVDFNLRGSGLRSSIDGSFFNLNIQAGLWTSEDAGGSSGSAFESTYLVANTSNTTYNYKYGLSIRLIKEDSNDPKVITDADGYRMQTVKVGSQVWTRENWRSTKLANGTLIPNVTNNASWASLTTIGRCTYENNESNV